MTPHVAGESRPREIAECAAENVARLAKGEALAAVVDWNNAY